MSDPYQFQQQQTEQIVQRLSTLEALARKPRADVDNGWGSVIGRHLALPQLRAFWPTNTTDQSLNTYDLSGQGRTLTANGSPTNGVYNGRVAYMDYNGTTAYHARADETGLDIASALTFGGWFWHDTQAATQALISKFNATGNQRAYALRMVDGAPDVWTVTVSTDGATPFSLNHTATVNTGAWHHIVGRYTPSTELALFVDGVKVNTTTSVPASIFNSSADLRIGALGDGSALLDGRAVFCFLCNGGVGAIPDALITELYATTQSFFV